MITLAKHIDALAADWSMWLRDPPEDLPEWARSSFDAARPGRLAQAAAIETEINDAIRALRRHGFLPGPGETVQPAGALSEGDAAQ